MNKNRGGTMEKKTELYTGKAKSIYSTDNPDLLIMEFRNDTSAFDGERIEQLERKGMVNNKFNDLLTETRLLSAKRTRQYHDRLEHKTRPALVTIHVESGQEKIADESIAI